VLPAWATVVLALGGAAIVLLAAEWATLLAALAGSAIGATAAIIGGYFTLRGTTLNVRYQEREAWRTRLIAAATAFHDDYTKTMTAGAFWVFQPDLRSDERRRALEDAGMAAVKSGTLVELLFGSDSAAGRAADDLTNRLSQAAGLMPKESADVQTQQAAESAVAEKMEEVEKAHKAFLIAVHAEVHPPAHD
jgi:hypothetical protein